MTRTLFCLMTERHADGSHIVGVVMLDQRQRQA
jgi:hypothetical protein